MTADPPSAEIVSLPLDPQARLRASLRMLQMRLQQQQESIEAWRASLSSLAVSLRKLSVATQACERDFAAASPVRRTEGEDEAQELAEPAVS